MRCILLTLVMFCSTIAWAQKKKPEAPKEEIKKDELSLSGIKFRNIGPALTSGRVSDFAVNPKNFNEYYVATASGGVWKTVNNGTKDVPSILSESITVDKANMLDTVVKDGFQLAEQLQ